VADDDPVVPDREHTAVHEAGHAVLQFVTGIGLKSVTIVPDFDEMTSGHALHYGESPDEGSDAKALLTYAEDAYYLRHAVGYYAGAEAIRQIRPQDEAEAGADSDMREAEDAVGRITDDPESFDLYVALAKRRCTLLVDHYRPEIEAVATTLLDRSTMSGEEVRQVVMASLTARRGGLWSW
jgi:ATP-dependent Zn protease